MCNKETNTRGPVQKKPISKPPSPTLWERILAFFGLR